MTIAFGALVFPWLPCCFVAALDGSVGVESDFGAALDMLTDRLSTGALLTLLSHFYPVYASLFLCLIVLDGYSHWLQMAAYVGDRRNALECLLRRIGQRVVLVGICIIDAAGRPVCEVFNYDFS